MNERTKSQKIRDAENALAQQALEGLSPSDAAREDLMRVARGEMTMEEALANVTRRSADETTGA